MKRPDFIPDENLEPAAGKIRVMLSEAREIVAFTGAGISAESGIPTYRGEGGMWTKYDPEKYASIDYFLKDPSYYWEFFKNVRHDLIADAKPNFAHYALADLEADGRLKAVITQNIDGLHQRAGARTVYELHGNTTRFYCLKCHREYDIHQAWDMVQRELPPACTECDGMIRPDVVLFGEMLPGDTVMAAERAALSCDLLVIIGSSLVVHPAADIPYRAKVAGSKLIIVNYDPTPLDDIADFVVHDRAARLIGQAVWGKRDEIG